MLNTTELEICARTIAELGCDQPDDVRSSLAWVLRNRFERTMAEIGAPPNIGNACASILREAGRGRKPQAVGSPMPDAEWCRIRAVNYLVWAGDVADQTAGAVACHRHDTSPAWSKTMTPTALIGSFLFFR
jgi:hypothetical protein